MKLRQLAYERERDQDRPVTIKAAKSKEIAKRKQQVYVIALCQKNKKFLTSEFQCVQMRFTRIRYVPFWWQKPAVVCVYCQYVHTVTAT